MFLKLKLPNNMDKYQNDKTMVKIALELTKQNKITILTLIRISFSPRTSTDKKTNDACT